MKTVGQKNRSLQRSGRKARVQPARGKNGVSAFEAVKRALVPRQVEDHLFLSQGLHVRVSDRDRGLRQARAGLLPIANAVVLGGSTDNEFAKLGWRRDHKDLTSLNHWQFADVTGSLVDQLGRAGCQRRRRIARATFVVDPDNTIQHVSVNNLNVGPQPRRSPAHPGRPADRRTVPLQSQRGRRYPVALFRHRGRGTT